MGVYDFFRGGPCPHCESVDISFSSEYGQTGDIQTKRLPYPSFKSYYPGDKLPILIEENIKNENIGETSCCGKFVVAVFERRPDGFTYLLKYVKVE